MPISLKNIYIQLHKLFPIIALFLILFLLYQVAVFFNKPQESPKAEVIEVNSVFGSIIEKPIFGTPDKIIAESGNINAVVTSVGVATDGSLETPKDWKTAGWYKDSAKPGQVGNLIINGHYDDNLGQPAAFWGLKNVKTGDKVSIVDNFGRRYEYKITSLILVGINDPDRLKIFDAVGGSEITLITCGGVWIPGRATYDKRLVLKGELIR